MAPFLQNLDQAFQYIQEYTGFISPGVVAVFILGLFWKKTSANAALSAVILSIPLSTAFKFLLPGLPFLDRMGICFLIIVLVMVLISLFENKADDRKAIYSDWGWFQTSRIFNVSSLLILGMLAVIYAIWW